MGIKKETKLNQDLARVSAPGQYVYHPACHCSRCLDKRQATSIKGQFRMILKSILNYKVTSYKLPGPKPISNANKGLIHKRQAASNKLDKPGL